MDYEQKYKEALERARELKNKLEKNCSHATPTAIESIFPELKKSEDEIVISALKSGIKVLESEYKIEGLGGLYFKKILAWLEKQGKRNNIVEQLTAFAQHLNKRGAFRDDLCMDFEHEAESFIESQKYNAKQKEL